MILAQRQAEKQSADKSQNSKIADKKEIMEEDKKPVGLIGRFKQLLGSSQPSEPQKSVEASKETKKVGIEQGDTAEHHSEDLLDHSTIKDAAKVEIKSQDIDKELLMKCLAEEVNISDSRFVISLFDFGGQSVFNVIHPFFLTRYGVYAVVFNMEWLLGDGAGGDSMAKEECLAYLNFWINSIVIHTYNPKTQETAPIVLIGTRKDKISSPRDHQAISLVLFEKFKNNTAWPFVIANANGVAANGRTTLWFFPVDNTQGREDQTMKDLLMVMEATIDQSDYVHEERPLVWLQTIDKLRKLSKSYITYEEIQEIGESCGVGENNLPYLLKFLHEMGILMWHEDEELRDIVILDPLKFFVEPVTVIICKHKPTAGDPTQHLLPVHKVCRKKYYEEWKQMEDYGILSHKLLYGLLSADYESHVNRLVHLMIKYGLLVPISFENEEEDEDKEKHHEEGGGQGVEKGMKISSSAKAVGDRSHGIYLVPALLPEVFTENDRKAREVMSSFKSKSHFYFVFTSSKKFVKSSIMTLLDAQENGFLPSGLFEKLICKAVSWCQETMEDEHAQSKHRAQAASKAHSRRKGRRPDSDDEGDGEDDEVDHNENMLSQEHFLLGKREAILTFGNQRFRLTNQIEYNSIKVEVEGSNPLAIHERLLKQLQKIIKECMKTLRVFTALELVLGNDNGSKGKSSQSEEQQLLINLAKLEQSVYQRTELNLVAHGSRAILSQKEIMQYYHHWVGGNEYLAHYDLFISYRWGEFDSLLVERLFEHFVLYNVAADARAISVFLDRQRLQEGRDFSKDFINALVHSSMIVPIMSVDAIRRMVSHNASMVDNVLLEWMLALECYREYEEGSQQQQRQHKQ
jgi:hypothetical protein